MRRYVRNEESNEIEYSDDGEIWHSLDLEDPGTLQWIITLLNKAEGDKYGF